MKKWYKETRLIIFGSLMGILGAGIPFAIYAICYSCSYKSFPYYTVHLGICFVYGLLAYVIGDIKEYKYKKSTGDINPVIPDDIAYKILKLRIPYIIALIITLLVVAILFIVYLISGQWPLL